MQFMPGGTSRTDKDGQFTLNGVTPGEYSLQVQSMGGMIFGRRRQRDDLRVHDRRTAARRRQPPQEREFAVANVNVAGEDITGMVVVGTRGAKATGHDHLRAAGRSRRARPAMRVTAPSVDADSSPMPMFGGASNVKDTGAFEVDGLIGQPRLPRRQPAEGLVPEARHA